MLEIADDMLVGTLVAWMGNKRVLAPAIVAELGPHKGYWEPFCGGMAVLLAKPESSHEHVNDLHGDLINLARVIQHHQWGPWLYRALRRTLHHQATFEASRAIISSGPCEYTRGDQCSAWRAYHYFVLSWIGRNGAAGTKQCNLTYARRFTTCGGHGGKRFTSAIQSIPAFRRRMRRTTILQMDGFELIESIEDEEGTVIYVDSPYLDKSHEYLHDFDDSDHDRLAAALHRFRRARVVVSYYEHPRLAELYPGWTRRRFEINKTSSIGQVRGAKPAKATELLLINGPSLAPTDAKLF